MNNDNNNVFTRRLSVITLRVNGTLAGQKIDTLTYSVYPNAYVSINGDRWTKHYYIGSERIASRTGTLGVFNNLNADDNYSAGHGIQSVSYDDMMAVEEDSIAAMYERFGVPYDVQHASTRGCFGHLYIPITRDNDDTAETASQNRNHPHPMDGGQVYYFHRDHLGGTLSVTDSLGAYVQQVEYTPWGEVFVELKGDSVLTTPVLFNGKELDEETGLYYYGARYYDPKMSVWYSTDPMHNIKPFISDYSYCFSNPFSITDPSGMLESTDVIKNNDGTYKIVGVHKDGDNNIYIVNQNGIRTGETIGSTIRPYDFMGTNDENGTFTNKTGIIIDLNNLYVSGTVHTENAEYSIYHANANDLLDWGMSIFREELKYDSYRTFYSELQILRRLSKDGEALDIKRSMGLDPYTPVRAGTNSEGKPIITTLRAVGNYLFGANVKSTKPLLFPNDMFYKSVMKKVGAYNQQQNHGNGYNPGFPYYGEHTYSGSFIYYGYYGRFY